MKAVTPVIATVMLMLITVGTVSMAYAWFSSMMTTQTEKNIAIPVGGVQCINNRVSVIVTNAGANSNITDDDIVVADVNGVSVRNTPFFGGFNTNGLVGYWRFEDNGTDSSGYGNTGTNASGAYVTTNGRFGNAMQFDGVNDYVNTTLSLTSYYPVTFSAWVKLFNESLPASPIYHVIVSNTPLYGFGLSQAQKAYNPNRIIFFANGTEGGGCMLSWIPSSVSVFEQWHHAVGTYDGTTARLYIDGKLSSSGTCIYTSGTPSSNVYIGGSADTTRIANGTIDEVMVWNRSLSADEITQLNKTNAGNFTMAPNRAVTLINGYPVFAKGKYAVRVGTRNGVMERTVECL